MIWLTILCDGGFISDVPAKKYPMHEKMQEKNYFVFRHQHSITHISRPIGIQEGFCEGSHR